MDNTIFYLFKEAEIQYFTTKIDKIINELISLIKELRLTEQRVREYAIEQLILEKSESSLDDSEHSQQILDLVTEIQIHNDELEQRTQEIQDLEKKLKHIKQ